METAPTSSTLGARGQIYVTLTVAEDYLRQRRQMRGCDLNSIETARRELTENLIPATCKREEEPGLPASYRARSRATQLDIGVTVKKEGALLVVLSVNVREHLK